MKKKVILGLAAHPDDLEFSCGASLAKWINRGAEVYYAAFSPCKKSVPPGLPSDILYKELSNSCSLIGMEESHIVTFDFPVREFPEKRQQLLEEMIQLRNSLQPDLVLIPNAGDIHQDHHQVYLEGRRAFRKMSILGYELVWNNTDTRLNYHIPISKDDLQKKIDLIHCYGSQKERPYANSQFIESWARLRGSLCNSEFAESFELINWIDD